MKSSSKKGWLNSYASGTSYVIPSLYSNVSESTKQPLYVGAKNVSTSKNENIDKEKELKTEQVGKTKKLQKLKEEKEIKERNQANKVVDNPDTEYFTFPNGDSKKLSQMNFRESQYVHGKALENKGRIRPEINSWLDTFSPINMVESMAGKLGEAPYEAQQSDSYLPYITSVGAPLTVGAIGGIGAKTTGQFINNLANPLAGTGEIIDNLGNKYLPNAYKLNPWTFKPNPEMGYRVLGDAGYADALESQVLRAKQSPGGKPSEGISLLRNTNRNPNTGKLQGALDRPYFADGFVDERYGRGYLAEVNKADNNLVPIPTHKGIAPAQATNIPIDNVNFYKPDWLQGYKKVPKLTLKQNGGIIEDDNGYWNPANHGKPVKINSNKITMVGVDQPLLGISDTGHQQIMYPDQTYIFDGSSVVEYPLMQKGGWIDKYNRGGVTWRNELQNGGFPFQSQINQINDQQEYINRVNTVKARMMKAETKSEKRPYTAINDSSGALGKYQWIPLYNPDIVEKYPHLNDFLNNPQAQEDYTSSKVPEYWATAYKLKEKYPELTKNYSADDLALLTHFQGASGLEKRLKEKTMDKKTKNNPSPNEYLERSYGVYKQNGGWLSNYNI